MTENKHINRKELTKGIILIKEFQKINEENNPKNIIGTYIFKIEITTMTILDIEINFSKSENIQILNNRNRPNKDSTFFFHILPFETKQIAKILLKKNFIIRPKFKMHLIVPEKNIQGKYIKNENENKTNRYKNEISKLNTYPFEFSDIDSIKNKLKNLEIKFIDIDFPTNDFSFIGDNNSKTIKNFDFIIHWRRPDDFVPIQKRSSLTDENINFLRIFDNKNDPNPTDIKQGILPTNHLDTVLSSLTEKNNLIKRIFKNKEYNEYGIYQIKLCINGEWKIIVIDDYVPCLPFSTPVVTNTLSNELWLLFIEKALAKNFGSYYNLINININDYLKILTGCPTFFYNLEKIVKTKDDLEIFYKNLKEYIYDKKYLVIATSKNLDEENNFIEEDSDNSFDTNKENLKLTIPDFGYTILDILNLEDNDYDHYFIILRRVWLDEEIDINVANYMKKIINDYPPLINKFTENNLLILKFEDFFNQFKYYSVCYTKNWEETRVRGKFVNIGINDCKTLSKWFYTFSLNEESNIIISLFQEDNDLKECLDISIVIVKSDTEKNELYLIKTYDFDKKSDIQIEINNLPKGNYIIYPRISGCFFSNKIYQNNINGFYDENNNLFSNIFIKTVKNIFKKFDMLLNGYLDYSQFKFFWECATLNNTITENDFNTYIIGKYNSFSHCITEKGFIDFFKNVYLSNDSKGKDEIKQWFKNLGYDNNLNPIKSKSYVLAFHSDIPLKVYSQDNLSIDLDSVIERLIIKSYGEVIKIEGEVSVLKYKSNFIDIYTIGVANLGNDINKVSLTFKTNYNIIFSNGKNRIEKMILPGKYEFFTNIFTTKNFEDNVVFEIEVHKIE